MTTLKFKRGLAASIPTLLEGEPGWCTDNHKLYVGNGGTNRLIGGPTVLLKDENSTINGNVTIGAGKTLVLAADPAAALQAATKQYVDAIASGLDIKASCRAATDENITLSGEQTIDGVSIVADDRVLVQYQTTGADNGIYVAKAGAWSRAADFDADAEVTAGAFTFIEEGTISADCGYVLTTNDPITVGTTALVFTQFSGAGTVGAGAGLSFAGTTLNVGEGDGIDVLTDTITVKLDGATLAKSGSGLKIPNGGVGAAQLATAVAGDGLIGGLGSALEVNEGDGLEIASDILKVKLDGATLARSVSGLKISDGGVGVSQIAAAIAGAGLAGGGGSALDVGEGNGIDVQPNLITLKLDASSLALSASGLKIANAGVAAAHLSSAIAGDGLLGGAGSALSVNKGDGLEIVTDVLKVKLDGTSLARSAAGIKANIIDGGAF